MTEALQVAATPYAVRLTNVPASIASTARLQSRAFVVPSGESFAPVPPRPLSTSQHEAGGAQAVVYVAAPGTLLHHVEIGLVPVTPRPGGEHRAAVVPVEAFVAQPDGTRMATLDWPALQVVQSDVALETREACDGLVKPDLFFPKAALLGGAAMLLLGAVLVYRSQRPPDDVVPDDQPDDEEQP